MNRQKKGDTQMTSIYVKSKIFSKHIVTCLTIDCMLYLLKSHQQYIQVSYAITEPIPAHNKIGL